MERGFRRESDRKMSSKNYFTVENLDQLGKAIDRMKAEGFTVIRESVDKASKDLLQKVKDKVPHKWSKAGQLKNSLYTIKSNEKTDGYIANIITWGDDVRDYAAPLELGHAQALAYGHPTDNYIQPNPFMRSAFDENADRIYDFIVDRMNKALETFGD
jgi:FAD/FMN-containing dehydrogenase